MRHPCWSDAVMAATDVVNESAGEYVRAVKDGIFPISAHDVTFALGAYRKAMPITDARIVAQVICLDHSLAPDGQRYSETDIARLSLCSQQAVHHNWRRFHHEGTDRLMWIYRQTLLLLLRRGFRLRHVPESIQNAA